MRRKRILTKRNNVFSLYNNDRFPGQKSCYVFFAAGERGTEQRVGEMTAIADAKFVHQDEIRQINQILNRNRDPMYCLFDPEHHTLKLSDGFRKLFRTEQYALENMPDYLLEHGIVCASSEETYKKMFAILSGKANECHAVIRLQAKRQNPVALLIHWVKIKNSSGRTEYIMGAAERFVRVRRRMKSENEHEELLELRNKLKLQEKYLEQAEEYQKEIRRYRHDRKNNLLAFSGLLKSGDVEGARKYLEESVTILNTDSEIVNTGNPGLDAVLSEKIHVAGLNGIHVAHIIGLPANIEINMKDLCLAIGSCMDNAIEACSRAKEKYPKPAISLELIEKHGVITFKMENTSVTPGSPGNKGLKTLKKDKMNHGFGLDNVRNIVSKYSGYMEAQPCEGIFRIAFTLFLNGDS